jgi:hypothetical protein
MPHPFAGHAFTLPQGSSPPHSLEIYVPHFEKGSIEDQQTFKETIAPAESGIVG